MILLATGCPAVICRQRPLSRIVSELQLNDAVRVVYQAAIAARNANKAS
jgi:hypothetical protein